jgi:hypothetical protein
MQKTLFLILSLYLFNASLVSAQDSTATSDKGTFAISGYIDSYYFKNLNNPRSGSNLGASGFERIFDQREGQFQLGLVQTKFAYSNSKSDVVVDLTFGPNADLGNYGNYASPLSFDLTSTAFAIKQAYFTYKLSDKLSFTAGQFGTHIGYEVIDAPINYNYSLSNLFGNGPFYHVGVKANYALSDKVGFMAGVVNNWDSNFDNNKFKTAIAQVFVSPAEGWNVYLNWIGGNEDTQEPINTKPETSSFKNMFDLTTGYQITDKFYLGFNGAYGMYKVEDEDMLTWGGAAIYANYALTDVFGLGIRAEQFDNTQGVQYLTKYNGSFDDEGNPLSSGASVTSLTLTGNITLADGHLLLKPEFRVDAFKKSEGAAFSNLQQFEDKNGDFTKNSQSTLGLAFIYKF